MSTRADGGALRLVISQPMFMPWRGMFEQIRLSDQFVFYDDVQLPLGGGKGRGFSTRVQIKTARGSEWLTLPVHRAGQGKQRINEARFVHMEWKAEHLKKISQAYRQAAYFDEVYETVVEPIYAVETASLCEFCVSSTRKLAAVLGLSRGWRMSSGLQVEHGANASERVLKICKRLGATEYISGLGAMQYLDHAIFDAGGVRVRYMDYEFPRYPQLHGDFTPYVSIIDMLFCIGFAATSASLRSDARYWKDWPTGENGRPVPQIPAGRNDHQSTHSDTREAHGQEH